MPGTGLAGRIGITAADIVRIIITTFVSCFIPERCRQLIIDAWTDVRNSFYRPTEIKEMRN